MLLFFAESCDSISQAVAKFVEKESLEGNSDAREIVRNNDFIKGKIAKDIAGEDEKELESILNKMKDEEKEELRNVENRNLLSAMMAPKCLRR